MDEEFYLVFGTGKSGLAAARLLLSENKSFLIFDGNTKIDKEAFYQSNPDLSQVPLYLGTLTDELYDLVTVCVLSPGVPTDLPEVEKMRADGIRIIGEVELAYSFSRGRIAAITGTNGKTTTTALCGQILRSVYPDVRVVGNIGIPFTAEAATTTDDTVIAAEISSFQLETIDTFHPQVSAILNITPDHLNRHHTMENYIHAKENITMRQNESDTVVLNYEDPVLLDFGKTLKTQVIWFSSKRALTDGYFFRDGSIFRARDGKEEQVLVCSQLQLLGLHNYENVMAALAVTEALGVPMNAAAEACRKFKAVPHRIEFICEKGGVRFYNDSKGTNPDAAIRGIGAMNGPTCLIGGGYDKKSSYDTWIESFGGKVKKLVLIGQTAQDIAQCAKKHGFNDFAFADTLEQAIDLCYQAADPGDNVLLSPACASWDMFPNYEIRGEVFSEYAKNLPERKNS